MTIVRQRGFTYLGLMFLILFIGVALALTGEVWHIASQREKEKQLLFVGDEFRVAIGRYYELSPGPVKTYPQQLEDLVEDPRFPSIRRYLRKIYVDPMTGKAQWDVLKIPGQGIVGVRSLSAAKPLKVANFDPPDDGFAGKQHYVEWAFVYGTAVAAGAPAVGAGGAGNGQPDAAPPPNALAASGNSGDTASSPNASPATAQGGDPHGSCGAMRMLDTDQCSRITSWLGAARGAQCEAAAQSRYSACIASNGTQVPRGSVSLQQ
ncbi:MAG TPA: type II secretion system protein [Burkholderiales bacterium]|nr:type II secretion system protein [Burkholderiales bacterium]